MLCPFRFDSLAHSRYTVCIRHTVIFRGDGLLRHLGISDNDVTLPRIFANFRDKSRPILPQESAPILPASLFYITIVVLLGHPSIIQSVFAYTFTTTYFFSEAYKPLQHLWSLSVEEQFYLLWPFIFATGVRNARRYCWIVMLVCPLMRIALRHNGYAEYSHCAPAIADSLAAGCLLAFYQDRLREFVKRYFVSPSSFLLLSAVTVGIAGVLYKTNLVLLWGLAPV